MSIQFFDAVGNSIGVSTGTGAIKKGAGIETADEKVGEGPSFSASMATGGLYDPKKASGDAKLLGFGKAKKEAMVMSSNAGAGSGLFHTYRSERRREEERLKHLREAKEKEIESKAFAARKKAVQEELDRKTQKNRDKRKRRKEQHVRKREEQKKLKKVLDTKNGDVANDGTVLQS